MKIKKRYMILMGLVALVAVIGAFFPAGPLRALSDEVRHHHAIAHHGRVRRAGSCRPRQARPLPLEGRAAARSPSPPAAPQKLRAPSSKWLDVAALVHATPIGFLHYAVSKSHEVLGCEEM